VIPNKVDGRVKFVHANTSIVLSDIHKLMKL